MVTLLGSLIGFISAAFPDLLKIWRDTADRKHELTILQMVRMPFYHPVLEEAIQPVLREMVTKGGFMTDDLPPDLERL